METIERFIDGFFNQERQYLLETYPGITLEILKREFFEFAGTNYNSRAEFYSSPKWWSKKHPNTLFFDQIKEGIPLQYITKKSFFYKYSFSTNPDVFIPRYETELLVEMGIKELEKITQKLGTEPKVLDCGTGTGIIIISLAEIPFEGIAYDLNSKAISLAKRNYFNLRFNFPSAKPVNFINRDFLENDGQKFHLIISNPPYIKKNEDKKSVHAQVIKHEPELALFLDDEKYSSWFEDFLNKTYLKLEKDGVFLMEGHENHLNNISKQAKKIGFEDIIIVKDLTGRDRFLKARKNG